MDLEVPQATQKYEPIESESEESLNSPIVLVIAEDDSLRQLLKLFLSLEGYQSVAVAKNVAEAATSAVDPALIVFHPPFEEVDVCIYSETIRGLVPVLVLGEYRKRTYPSHCTLLEIVDPDAIARWLREQLAAKGCEDTNA